MKKLITLIAGLLFVALPVGLAGCDDSDKEIYNDGRLVTDVVIPTSMTVYRGMEVSVSGYGFAQGDAPRVRRPAGRQTRPSIRSCSTGHRTTRCSDRAR